MNYGFRSMTVLTWIKLGQPNQRTSTGASVDFSTKSAIAGRSLFNYIIGAG
jgi:hypothetical protein